MSNSQLKKEFAEKDIKRIRNIIEKRFGDSTNTQVGFEHKKQEYKEGEEFEENGKTWVIKNGIKQTVTKMDAFKKSMFYPLSCPCCKNHFKLTDINKKMYGIHGKCLDCVIEMETKLKLEGKFEEYERELMNKNRLAHLEEFEKALDEYANSKNESFVTENGVHESWLGGGVDLEYIKKMKEQIKEQKSKSL